MSDDGDNPRSWDKARLEAFLDCGRSATIERRLPSATGIQGPTSSQARDGAIDTETAGVTQRDYLGAICTTEAPVYFPNV